MVKQLSVFVQNESGKISAVTRALADGGVDLRALSIADTTDFGILRMLVSDADKAAALLKGQGCIVKTTQVTVVAVPDRPGGLATVLETLARGSVDIEYMYSLIGRGEKKAYMVFRVSDDEMLRDLLAAQGLACVDEDELGIR